MSARTITFETKGYLTGYSSVGPKEFKDDPVKAAESVVYGNLHIPKDWTFVGKATITLELPTEQALGGAKVEALSAELRDVRAKLYSEETRIKAKINELLAITNEVEQ